MAKALASIVMVSVRHDKTKLHSLSSLSSSLFGLGGHLILRRFPSPAEFDFSPKDFVGSATQARAFNNARGTHDMCASGDFVLPRGSPTALVDFPVAWGGVSLFVPIGPFGEAAWVYAIKVLGWKYPGLRCRHTVDPTISCSSALTPPSVVYVHDRTIGRLPEELIKNFGAKKSETASFMPLSESGRFSLAHHILLTVKCAVPTVEIDRIAQCVDWEDDPASATTQPSGPPPASASTPPFTDCSAADLSCLCTRAEPLVPVPTPHGLSAQLGPLSFDWHTLSPDEDPEIPDEQLADVCLLLAALLRPSVPVHLQVEALLYTYLFAHRQPYFAGRLDRIVALDDGRCAALLLAAEEIRYPGGEYGTDEWAHGSVGPIAEASLVHLHKAAVGGLDTAEPHHGITLAATSLTDALPRQVRVILP